MPSIPDLDAVDWHGKWQWGMIPRRRVAHLYAHIFSRDDYECLRTACRADLVCISPSSLLQQADEKRCARCDRFDDRRDITKRGAK